MKPSIPKGTRDFGPQEVIRRNFLFDTIRKVFVRYGYQPIETPAMESLSTLTGKYGEEGDKLLFKVLNNGDYLAKADEATLRARDSYGLISSISKRGLRYDLTVPFARFVVMHQHELNFPFKRYQIQPVWRADRPQKGRYREFYQCDVDVVGADSLMYEAELARIYDEVFAALGLPVIIRLNNRKILAGIAEVAGIPDQFMDMTIAVDKLDKIGVDGVKKELLERGIPESAVHTIIQVLDTKSLPELKQIFDGVETGTQGVEELETVFRYLRSTELKYEVKFDITLARGLNYYTGCIFEVQFDNSSHPGVRMGSIGGGGRYDDLTGIFGLKNVSGVGVSFGAERIYDLMLGLDLFPQQSEADLELLIVAFDQESHHYAFQVLTDIRKAGINADLYPEPTKLKKQMKYANDRNVPWVVLIGEEERQSGRLSLKHMASGKQESLSLEEVIGKLSS